MASEEQVAEMRDFNRFYTRRVGLTRNGYAQRSLAEARVIYELGTRGLTEVQELKDALDIDAGQLSRLLTNLKSLVRKSASPTDGRRQRVELNKRGQAVFAEIDAESSEEIAATLDGMRDAETALRLMRDLRRAIDANDGERDVIVVRDLAPGDLGWMVERHGVLYAREYQWNSEFERLVARIAADFNPERDRAFIAEYRGKRAGVVLCVHEDDDTAKLRTLLVEPHARRLGLGTLLVREVIKHAQRQGYTWLKLWTNDVLHAARRIYEREGFALERNAPHHAFGHDLVEQSYCLKLASWQSA